MPADEVIDYDGSKIVTAKAKAPLWKKAWYALLNHLHGVRDSRCRNGMGLAQVWR